MSCPGGKRSCIGCQRSGNCYSYIVGADNGTSNPIHRHTAGNQSIVWLAICRFSLKCKIMFSLINSTEFIDFSELKQNPNPNPYLTIDMLLDVVVKRNFHYYLWVGIYYMWWVAVDVYPETVVKTHCLVLPLVMYTYHHTIFGFCLDLLNSVQFV